METSDRTLANEIIAFLRTKTDQAWIVGGYVHDRLLSRPTVDIDVVVSSHGMRLARAVADRFGGAFYALDSTRDIGRALLVNEHDRMVVDISRIQGQDLKQDLSQRDFTINAMAFDLSSNDANLIDLHDGLSDLYSGLIRALSKSSFEQDPVRLLRALRFEGELDFAVEDQTESWLRRDAGLLVSASSERLQHELVLLFRKKGAAERLRRLNRCRLLEATLPELCSLKGVTQSEPHHLDVFNHTLKTVDHLETVLQMITSLEPTPVGSDARPAWLGWPMAILTERLAPLSDQIDRHLRTRTSANRTRQVLLKWAAMLHDVGKPATRSVEDDGRIRFLGHAEYGAELADTAMHRLRFSGSEAAQVNVIVRHHLRPSLLAREPSLSRRAVYRFFRDTGATGIDICLLSLADHLATWGKNLVPDRWERRVETVETLLTAFIQRREADVAPAPLITGDDLIERLGMRQGPAIGIVLEQVRESQAAGEVSTRDDALHFARRIVASLS